MLLLSFLPNFVFTLFVITGILAIIASIFLKVIPIISTYAIPLQLIGILLTIIGVFYQGVIQNEDKWLARIKELEEKVAAAELKSKEVNTVIEEKVVKKIQLVKLKGDDIIKYVDREVVKDKEVIKFVENCPIPDTIVKTHNAAAMNQAVGEKK